MILMNQKTNKKILQIQTKTTNTQPTQNSKKELEKSMLKIILTMSKKIQIVTEKIPKICHKKNNNKKLKTNFK